MENIFQQRLLETMKKNNIRQVDLVNSTGIGKSAINQYIKGINVPKQERLFLIADALKVDPFWLSGQKEINFDDIKDELISLDNQETSIYYSSFKTFWENFIENKKMKIDNLCLTKEDFEYLKRNKDEIYTSFINKALYSSDNYFERFIASFNLENIFKLSVKNMLSLRGITEIDTLQNLLNILEDTKEKIDKNYFFTVNGQKHFNNDFNKETYDRLMHHFRRFENNVKELYNDTYNRYFK